MATSLEEDLMGVNRQIQALQSQMQQHIGAKTYIEMRLQALKEEAEQEAQDDGKTQSAPDTAAGD